MKNKISKWDVGGGSRSIIQGLNLFTSRNLFKSLKSILMVVALLSLSSNVWGDTWTLSYTDFTNVSYADNNGDHAKSGITYTSSNVYQNSSKMQFKSNSGYIYNKTAMPGNITKITLSTATNFTIKVGTSANPSSGTTVTSGSAISGSNKYFLIKAGESTPKTATITVEYSSASSTYTVNYTLNSGTHGTNHPTSGTIGTAFAVSAPTRSGYTFTGWTVTSGLNTTTAKWGTTSSPSTSLTSSSTKCVNGTSDVYFTDLGSASGTVTLTANWQVKQAATITLMEAGTAVDGPSSKYSGDSYTLPSSVSHDCGTKTFVGWSTVEIQNPGAKPISNFYEPGDEVTLAANNTFYAVFADASSGGEASYKVTTTLTQGETYIFGAVKAAASSTLANNTTFGAVAFTNTYNSSSPNWGQRVDLTPDANGKIAATNTSITNECKWVLESIDDGNYKFKKGTNYLYLGTSVGSTSGAQSGISTTGNCYIENVNSTCKDAFLLHPASSSTNIMLYNTGYGYRMYASRTYSATIAPYVRFYEYNPGVTYSNYTTSCCTPLAAPTNLSAGTPGATSATITWSAVANATGYEYKLGDGAWTTAGNLSQTITSLTPCNNYSVHVRAIYSGAGNYCAEGPETSIGFSTSGYTYTFIENHVSTTDEKPSTTCGGDVMLGYVAESNYTLPTTITVEGASNYDWENGVLLIEANDVTGNVTVTITAVANACSSYSFSYGEKGQAYTTLCFEQVDGTNEWKIENFVFPDVNTNQACYVGYQGNWYNDNLGSSNSKSADLYFADFPLALMQGVGGCPNTYKVGWSKDNSNGHNAIGALRIYTNYTDDNLYVGFIPNGYGMQYGTEGQDDWQNIAFTDQGNNAWMTDLVTLTSDMVSNGNFKYWVGLLKNGGGYTYSSSISSTNTFSTMGSYCSNWSGTHWGANLSGYSAGDKGKFRIWVNSCNGNDTKNFVCHFVPFYQATFDAAGGTCASALPAEPISAEESAVNRTITLPTPTKTGYDFAGWNDGVSTVAAGTEVELTSNKSYTAQWTIKTTAITLSKNGGTNNGSAAVTYGSATLTSITHVTYSTITKQLIGYAVSGSPSLIVINANGELQANIDGYTNANHEWINENAAVTLVAQYNEGHTVTFSAPSGDTERFVITGQALGELPTDPGSCDTENGYTTFIGWSTAQNGTADAPSATLQGELVTAATVPEGNETYYAVWGNGGGVTEAINEDFSDASAGNNTSTTGSGTKWDINANFTEGANVYQAGSAIRLGTSSNPGSITTKTITATSGSSMSISFDVKGWSSVEGKITISVTNCIAKEVEYTAKMDDNFESKSVDFTLASANPTVTIATTSKRAFIDNLVISAGTPATGYISTCCASTAVVTVTPTSSALALNIDGQATTTVHFEQTGAGSGRYYEPTITPAEGASLNWAGSYKEIPYNLTFTATQAGSYEVKGNFTETGAGCAKYGSATITVAANPLLIASTDALTVNGICESEGTPSEVTINSRYLTSANLTAIAATTAGSGAYKVSTDGTNYSTEVQFNGGISDKGTQTLYIRYDGATDEAGVIAGTVTISGGGANQVINLSGNCTCGTYVKLTPTDANSVRILAPNGQWTQTMTPIAISAKYLSQANGGNGVKIKLSSNNEKFKFTTGGTSGQVEFNSEKVTADTYNQNIYLVYTPTSNNANEQATITAEVITWSGTTVHASADVTAYGRSLPETFVLALYTGSQWVAVPADMIPPYGGSQSECATGVGTHDPYPITVDNNANPTVASDVPARAIYKGAGRNTPTTQPWTVQFESNSQATYMLWGSQNATTIANQAIAVSENIKWNMFTNDLVTFQMKLKDDLNTRKLGYNGTSGQNNIGQYSSTASGYKYDFRILPITGDPCYYYVNPVMTVENYTATTTTISIPYDGTTNYMYSDDNKANWTAISGTIDCKKLFFEFANSTFKGKDIWMKANAVVCQGDATSETAVHIPNPSISVSSSVEFDVTQNVAFNGEIDLTLTDIWTGAGGGVNVATATTAGITAVYNSTTGKIDVSMAGKAPGDYEASLTISSVGATSKTVNVTIHVLSLATQTISCAAISNGVLCGLTTSTGFVLDGAFYKNGTILSQMSDFNSSSRDVIDVASGTSIGGMNAALSNGVVTLTMQAGTISAMVVGHVYRVTWENAGHDLTNSAGVEYANCHLDFVYSENCDAPTAMVPCVTGPNSAIINWAGDCDAATSTVSVYTKEQQELYKSSLKSGGGITWNKWDKYNYPSQYYSKWFYYLKLGSWTAPTATYGPFINKASTNIYLYTPQIGNDAAMDWGSMDKTDIANIDFTITVEVYCYNNAKSLRCFIVDGDPTNTTGTTEENGKDVYWNGASVTAKSYVSETVSPTSRDETLKSFTVRGLTATSRIAFCVGSYASSAGLYVQKVKIVAAKKGTPTNVNESCASGEKAISGLTANTTYFATVTNNGNTSNEVSFKTYDDNGTKSLVFKDELSNPVTTVMVLGGVGQEKTITVEGTKLAGCDIQAEVSAGYGLDDSGLTFDPATGAVGGTVVITLTDPTVTEGTFTITDGAGTVYTLNLTSSNCPAGINTMATAATGITDHGANANWSTTVTSQAGTLELYKNGIVNRELIENGGFEANTLAGWNNYEVGYGYSCDEFALSSTNARTGSYCLSVTDDGSAFPGIYSGFSLIYSNAQVLEPGTYRFSAWVKVRNETGNDNKDDFKLAFTGGYWNGSSSQPNKAFVWSETRTVQASEGYVQLTAEFELSTTLKCHPVIAVKGSTGTFRDFWLDDVTLIRTSAPINDEPHQIYNIADLSVGTQALTDLSGNTSYSYKLINEDGCESNTITFVTTQPGAPVIEAESITLTASQDKTANGVIIVSAIDAYAPITITSCGDPKITLNVSSVSSDGGAVLVTFNPGSTPPGTSGKCTLSLSTMGLDPEASVKVDVNWVVTAGEDVNTPKVDVTEVWTDSLTIEHNVGLDAVDSVYVQFNREKTEEEIVKNVGDEIFFSKYYEATGDLKLWAIFNPTNDTISLEGMEVWRSKSDGTWNTEQVIDLSDAGWYKRGWISPQEEIIVYTVDKVGGCEQRHADMTTWWKEGRSTMQPLSFSGDDALLLVRNTSAESEENNNILPKTSAKDGDDGDPDPISWPDAITARESNWYMLDIIGAHDGLYAPDDSECKTWNWHNSKTGLDESGDAAGWTGYGSDMQGSRDYNGGQGYLLSTNRCLLVRSKEVTSGANALAQNINDMFTLSTEWQGSHVPTSTPGMTQDSVSCVNFTYVGGYNYAGYYNSWTKMDDINMPAEQNPDGSWTVEVNVPIYSCKMFHIEAVKMDTINGVVSPNVVTSIDYKVPIVVDKNKATTADLFNFGGDTCATCDVVVRDSATLSHVAGGKSQFRELIVYPGAKFDNSSKQGFLLDRITVQSKNTEVGYAIINDNGSTIDADEVRHVKRVDDQHWYSFSLPYDCKISSIQQQNGKSMGEYSEDWVIAYYDGARRQADKADEHIGESSQYWIDMPSDGVLEANKAYIIGLYTTEWPGQVKNVYFPPYVASGHDAYTESGDDAKTANIYNWTEGVADNPARNHGWNFVGSPYISKFNETTDGQGLNNGSLIMKGKMNEAGEITEDLEHVYISVPADDDMMTYNQVLASSQKILPFTGYFVQAVDPTSGSNDTLELEYAKGNRTLTTPERRATATRQRVLVELNVIAPNGDKDNTGIWVDDRYTVNYEIGRDLMKMYGEAGRPQLYSRAADNIAMAYIALPDDNAEYIPLELYAPKAGKYTLKIDDNTSMTAGAQTIELLYNNATVADLFFEAYDIEAPKAGTIKGYAVRIRRWAQVITSDEQIGGQNITIIANDGQMSVTNLPTNATVTLYDVLGHLMATGYAVDGVVNFNAPATGVYNIVVESAVGHTTIKTVIK